ncbi:hypothetical protein K2173_002276 [Erythroxylum novogranatense]|uniref:UBP-type domain-containing protein n=1 Tax=Erythroxylum novogranatense TaxID=1862640 RepID=A0AAV8T9N9_9ROSI|nr:hypothetical protein K2173_002276 [Erythroxylum novogranatense]
MMEDDELTIPGAESGWVEARTSCDHLAFLSSDLVHIPTPDSSCYRCEHPRENWLCLSCKDVLCSRFMNKHMLLHYQQQPNHCIALSFSDLSVISQLRPFYETAYILKFGEPPPFRVLEQHATSTQGSSSTG